MKKYLLGTAFALLIAITAVSSALAWVEAGETCWTNPLTGITKCFQYIYVIPEVSIERLKPNVCLSCPKMAEDIGGMALPELENFVKPNIKQWAVTTEFHDKFILDFEDGSLARMSAPEDVCYDLNGQSVCREWAYTPATYCTDNCEAMPLEGAFVDALPEMLGVSATTLLLEDFNGEHTYLLDFETGALAELTE